MIINFVLSISANVLKEILDQLGGIIFSKEFNRGDQSMTLLELWISEYQESNALLTIPNQLQLLEKIARRERCPLESVGIAFNLGQVRFS